MSRSELTEDVLQKHGIDLSPDAFMDLVVETVEEMPVTGPGGDLDLDEETRQELRTKGVRLDPYENGNDPSARTVTRYSHLIATGFSTREAARLLGVQESRIRQRLAGSSPTLYGFKHNNKWVIPRFQFDHQGLVPGIDQVIPELPGDLHPLEVQNWFRIPNPDLEVDGEKRSPLEWLGEGRSPSKSAAIASRMNRSP